MSNESSIHEDISYMRQLAEAGRKGPILGGVFLAAAGIVFGLTCFVSWAGHEGLVPIRGWNELYLWLGAFVVFAVFWIFMFLRIATHKGKVSTASSSTFGTIWSTCGAGVMVAFGTTELISAQMNTTVVLAAYVPVIFAFYGTAWFACGVLGKRAWMYLAGLASFVFAFIVAALTNNPLQTPAMGLGLLLLLSLPGFKLMASEAKS